MNRFHIPADKIHNDTVIFSPEQTKHIRDVLRLKKGERILVFDGTGNEYEVELERISPRAEGKIVAKKSHGLPSFHLTLAQSIPKGDKMDWIVEKGTEIGIDTFRPFISERTVVKIDEKNAPKKKERWQKIAVSAAEQCRGFFVPEIANIITFQQALERTAQDGLRLILWEEEKNTALKNILRGTELPNITIFVGPEGGFSSAEIEQAKNADVIPVTLGPRILRSETTGLVVSAIIAYELSKE